MTTITVLRIGDGRTIKTAFRPALPPDVPYAVVCEYCDRFDVRVSDADAARPDVQAAVTRAQKPTGVPPTGQTTSYHAGDDGDLRAGGGVLPVTGQTTSHHDGDDGDLQAGFKGE